MIEKKDVKNFKLLPCPVPSGCWYSNLRTLLPKKAWDIIRKDAYARANGKCMICGAKKAKLEAHENWEYDEKNKVQRLKNVVAVCHDCHSVIHIGRTQLTGGEDRAIKHFCKVNDCGYSDYIRALKTANADNARRSAMGEWQLDVSYLKTLFDGEESDGEESDAKCETESTTDFSTENNPEVDSKA